MNRGKHVCKALKELRRNIAEANGIAFETEECTYDGPCRGTCPRCEQELRQLEEALRDKERRGEPVALDNLMGDEELLRALGEEFGGSEAEDPDDNEMAIFGIPAAPDDEMILEGIETVVDDFVSKGYIKPRVRLFPDKLLAEELMRRMPNPEAGQNVLFSPIGVASVLTMLRYAADDKSPVAEHIEVLLNGFSVEAFDDCPMAGVTLKHATSLWTDRKLGPVKKSYAETIRRIFGAGPQTVDFADSEAVKAAVDKWASEHTRGMVGNLDLQTSRQALMLLVDALYMKAVWDVPFDTADTRRRTFTNADGTTSRIDMMHLRTHDAEYVRTDDYQAVTLQYRGCDVFMTIVLPRKGRDLAEVMCSGDWLDIDPEDDYDIDLRLPRFRLDCKTELDDTLKTLGLGPLFDTETALPEMTDAPAHVGRIFQQCALSVTEQGTEAAAVTVAEMEVGCTPPTEKPKYHHMTVDRPFGFAIQDVNDNVLFMGLVNHLDDGEPERQPLQQQSREGRYITSMNVAGTSHVKNIDSLADKIGAGTELQLRHEVGNRHDSNAIAVYLGEDRLGYVPRKDNKILARLLDAGLDLFAVVTSAEWRGDWLAVSADILLSQG